MKLNKKLFGRSLYKIATILFLVGYNFAPAVFAIGDIPKLEVKQDQSVSVTTEEASKVLNEVPVDTSEDIHEKGISDPASIAEGKGISSKEVPPFREDLLQRAVLSSRGQYTVSSTSGIWTSIDGSPQHSSGIGTPIVEWGTCYKYNWWGQPYACPKQSGLGFNGTAEQSFNPGEKFLIGDLTHFNWPVSHPATGATLKVTLNFSNPALTPNPTFEYDFKIKETTNTDYLSQCVGHNTDEQISNTPCDDVITFPNAYGQQVFTIGDVKYTLVVDGFQRAYPAGSPISKFVTEENKDNKAFLVGHLSSVLIEDPAISIIKKVNGEDANTAPGIYIEQGDPVAFEYFVQNTGNVRLTNITVTDDKGVNVSCPQTSLEPGASMTCTSTGTYTAILGPYTNIGTVVGTHSTGTVTANDPANYTGVGKIDICHATSNHGDPYESAEAIMTADAGGYDGHNGPVWYPGITVTWGDIIPPFDYYGGHYPGKNWDAYGQSVLANGCTVPTGTLKVNKVTIPSTDTTSFNITGTGTPVSSNAPAFFNGNTGTISHGNPHTYTVSPGTYSVSETVPTGWKEVSNTCNDIVIAKGETKECTITNTKYGSITIVKDARPSSDQVFSFTTEGTGLSNFTLIDNYDDSNPSKVFENLLPGTYSVTEDNASGWDLTSATCSDGSFVSAINLSAGEDITCTFVNEKRGSISGHKYYDEDGKAETTNDRHPVQGWTIFIDANNNGVLDEGEASKITGADGKYTFSNIKPGTYTIIEVMQSGWINLTGKTQTITIVAGENRENVDFVNIEYPTIQVIKKVDTNGDGTVDQENATDWEWKLDTATYQTGIAPVENMPGTYTVSETQKPNYHVTSLVCKNGETEIVNTVSESVDITLKSGDKVVCTFTNARNLGKLIVKKVVINDNGGTLEAKDFSFKIDGGTPIQFEEDGQNEYTKYAGLSYNIVEVEADQRGYTTTYDNCSNVTVPHNGEATCTIRNDDNKPSLKLVKEVVNDNGGDKVATDWTLTATGPVTVTGDGVATSGDNFEAGTYTLSEAGKAGVDVSGYKAGNWSCKNDITVNENNQITIPLGKSTVCTIVNDDIAPVLILDKEVDNKDIPQDLRQTASSWTLTATGPTSLSGQGKDNDSEDVKSGNLFRAGTYTLSETEDIPGFKSINGWVCTDAQENEVQHGENEDQVTLNPGDVVTCKIVNESVHGKIVIKKVVEPNTDDKEFEFKIDDVVTGEIGHGGELSKVVTAGSYSISEEVPKEGWNLRDVTCSNDSSTWSENTVRISVADNETVTCTFTNEKLGKISGYKYEDKNGNGTWDDGEIALSDWTIESEDQNGNVKTAITNADGSYEFTNLPVGNTYIVTEENQEGWKQTSTNPSAITIVAGSDVMNVNFGNFENVTISVTKDVVGIDGVTDVADSTEFKSLLNGADAKTIAEGTTAKYKVEDPGTYSVTESDNADYDYIGCFLGNNEFSNYSVESGQTYNVVCKNKQKPATLIVNKSVIDSENNDDGVFSEDEFDVVLGEETKQIADKEGGKVRAVFDGLQPGDHKFTETPKDGYIFEGCTNDGEVTLGSNKTVEVVCTNKVIDPILEIEKSNDKQGIDQYAGNKVIYTIKVTAPDDGAEGKYILKNVVVSDIAPAGFKYIPGTWTAKKNGVDMVIPEPTYNGTDTAQWVLGDMVEGDEIVLTYKTKISLLTDPGVYPDIAWVKGVSASNNIVLGNVSTGADTPFVGTEVKVIEDDIVEEGEVLGASITLPNTGASTYLTLGALIMMILGAISLLFKPFKKFKYALLASVVVFGMFLTVLPTKVSAVYEVLIAKIEKPVSPTTKKAFNIDFTAQDVYGVDIKVECYKNDVKFATFDKVNAGACPVTVDASGTYTFYVKAISTSGEVKSEDVTVEVIDKPLPVIDYSKAGNVLKFKTANDAKIVKVEIHRSEKPSYTANDTTKIHTMNVAPNTAYSWTDASAEPGKTYYYALRSLDAFGNVSTMVSDPEVKVTQEATTTPPRATGTEVAGAETKTEGEVKGDTDKEEPKEVEQVQDGKENPQPEKEGEEKEVELTPSYKKYWYIWVPAILLILGVGYMYVKRSKEE